VNRYSLTHIPDPVLLRDLKALLSRECATTAELLAHLAEVDARRLWAPAGYPSMFAWCVEELHLSEDAAFRRIRAARVARQFPAVFTMLADGRLHLSAVGMLAPCLTPENADELLATATHQNKAGIERLLAERFPQPDLPARIEALAPALQLVPGRVGTTEQPSAPGRMEPTGAQLVPGRVALNDEPPSPETVHTRLAPLAPGRYAFQFTVAQDTYEKLRYAQALLGHAVPSGELAEVFDRALDALISRLEQRKFAATTRPRQRRQRTSASARHVPADVRRAVWERDGGRCTFVSTAGHRCESRARLEYDHIEPVARGGRATVKGMRLRCRAHNQYAAECVFGAGFMSCKREVARHASEAARSRDDDDEVRALAAMAAEETRAREAAVAEEAHVRAAAAAEETRAHAAATSTEARIRAAAVAEVVPWLRALGLRADEARRVAARCEVIPDAPLEERVRCALSGLVSPSHRRVARVPPPAM